MLSSTHSIQDVQIKLVDGYAALGFASESAFINAIISALEDAQYLHMLPVLGIDGYADIEEKDKVDLEPTEMYLYLAEIYHACSSFLKMKASSSGATSSSNSKERLKVEGYEYEITSGESSGQNMNYDRGISEYNQKAISFLSLAGYNAYQLQRGSGMFGTEAY